MMKMTGGLALAGLVTPAFAQQQAARLPVVATFSILGDFVANVGGDRLALTTLVGPDGDGHVYSPTPADARRMTEARVVFVNGLQFEGWIRRLVRSSGTRATVVEATRGIRALKSEDDHKGHSHGGHDHGEFDPHAWQSVASAKVYVANIRDALITADADGRDIYTANAASYTAELDKLDAEIRAAIERIPVDRRKIITSHDAFAYFEDAYGLEFISPQGVSTESEASARDVARIIAQIRREKIAAVFLENISDPRLIKRIADETGARIGGTIYSDALSKADGPASTYLKMMRHNIGQFASVLTS
jgi:zinc/manganese transport system substrate-binding protein